MRFLARPVAAFLLLLAFAAPSNAVERGTYAIAALGFVGDEALIAASRKRQAQRLFQL